MIIFRLFFFNNLTKAIPNPHFLMFVRFDSLLLVSLNRLLLDIILVMQLKAVAQIKFPAVSGKITKFKSCNVSCVLSVTDLVYFVDIRRIPSLLSVLRCRRSNRRMMLHVFWALLISNILKVFLGLESMCLL